MRSISLLVCLALAGCANAGASSTAFAPEPQAAATVANPPVVPGPASQTAENTRGRRGAKPKAEKKDDADDDWWKQGGITREKISAMCWMKYEKGRADLPLDKRADLVNACVEQTLKEHPLR